MDRRLSAILAADVVGYSRLMRSNEVGTLQALKAHRSEVIDGLMASHSGRIVKNTGDGFIAEFPSVNSAVRCASEIQLRMRERNGRVPEDRCIEYRIGINAGDIIHDEQDIFGDGVNLAARIEALARPGGVAVSGPTRDQLGDKAEWTFEDAGEHLLKNIDQPVRVFHLAMDSQGSPQAGADEPRRQSLAVLPFVNMSGDAEQEYFADGMTEDLITDLSKISALFVVGRNSVFAYKGKAVNLVQIARELGVRYLLEGSVRKSGQKVRITAQFIDGSTGGHIWADRYDRDLTDIFTLQDEITSTIVEQLQIKLRTSEAKAIRKQPTTNIDAYSCYLKGRQFYHMRSKKFLDQARAMFARAVELDPQFARAYAGIADCDSFANSWFGAKVALEEILATTSRAIDLEPSLAEAHAARGLALLTADRGAEAAHSLRHALSIDPLCYEPHYYYARYCVVQGDYAEAARHFIRALEIRPDDYRSPLLLDSVFRALGRDDEREKYVTLGLKRAELAAELQPDSSDPLELGASVLAANGHKAQAKEWLERALQVQEDPDFPRYNIACTYANLGEFELALGLLEKVVRFTGPEAIQWIKSDPDMDPLRDHPRYLELMGKF